MSSPAMEPIREITVHEELSLARVRTVGGGSVRLHDAERQRQGGEPCSDCGKPDRGKGGGDPHGLHLGGTGGSLDHSM
jgi:hypothetical protein